MSRKAGYQRARRARLKAAKAANEGGGSSSKNITSVMPTEINETRLNADDPKALEKLRAMAERGEIPQFISGSRENQAKVYEEIDKLYAQPSGLLGETKIISDQYEPEGIRLQFPDFASGAEPAVRYPSHRKASEAEKRGVLKHTLYQKRPELEYLYMWRRGRGGYWYDKSYTWHGRAFTSKEKAELERDWDRGILKAFGSPITKQSIRDRESQVWKKLGGDYWVIQE